MHYSFHYQQQTIVYQMKGKGPLVLLLHGFGEDSEVLQSTFDLLTDSHQVVMPDLPGSGRSPFQPNVSASIGEMATAMHALMQSISPEIFTALGHSMGGYITLAMAQLQPSRLQAIGLLHSTAFADSEEKKATRRQAMEIIAQKGSEIFLKTAIPGLFTPAFAQQYPDTVAALVANGKNFSPHALIAYYQAMIDRPDTTEVLRLSQVPVLFLLGKWDKACPLNDLMQQIHLPKNATVVLLEQTAHMGMYEEPDLFNKAILTFMKNFG